MINWSEIKHFKRQDFSEDPDVYASPLLIHNLDEFRNISGFPVHPSPAPGALARTDPAGSKSMHYAHGDIRSRAIDVFCEEPIQQAWIKAVTCGLFGGVGIYFDTFFRSQRHPMLHLDCRPLRGGYATLWYRDNGQYYYPSSDVDAAIIMFKKISELKRF